MDKNIRREKYKLLEPVIYPPLKQNFSPLDIDEDKYQNIGKFTMNLLILNENSIYKLLYNKEIKSDLLDLSSNHKSIRSDYLKRLVEVNDEYFPQELIQEKFKRKADLSFEEKLKIKILPEKKTEKKNKKKEELNLSRKASISAENILEENEVKNKKIKSEDQLNVVEENESEVEEKEEQSYEDEDFLMNSDDAGDAGDGDESEANYSDGGVF